MSVASRKSTSVARSARRAEPASAGRLGRYACRVAAELGHGGDSATEALEAVLADEKLVAVGRVVQTFVGDVKGHQHEREQREVLFEADFPPVI